MSSSPGNHKQDDVSGAKKLGGGGSGGGSGGVRLELPSRKKKRSKAKTDNNHETRRGQEDSDNDDDGGGTSSLSQGPLVIPVLENTNRSLSLLSREDAQAALALMEEQQATTTNADTDDTRNGNKLVINNNNTDNSYKKKSDDDALLNLQDLPDEMALDSQGYQRVPIDQFGAALLRGMGWQEDNNDKQKKSKGTEDFDFPRPHRLGLGAVPKPMALDNDKDANASHGHRHRRPRRPDQVKRQERLEQEQLEYQQKRRDQTKLDKQQTMQNGSIVFLHTNNNDNGTTSHNNVGARSIRARILQLTGVPGLNKVRVWLENKTESTIVQRGSMDRLVTRQELLQNPYSEPAEPTSRTTKNKNENNNSRSRSLEEESRRDVKRTDRSHREEGRSKEQSSSSKRKRSREEKQGQESASTKQKTRHETTTSSSSSISSSWLIPHIRVRVVTERLGRRHYKEKGVVVDVTPAGATVQMDDRNRTLLDAVPERYLETALPKPGGKAVVLAASNTNTNSKTSSPSCHSYHKFQKGKLLERNSREGVIQVYEDGSVIRVPLDDMAEWCGPLDED